MKTQNLNMLKLDQSGCHIVESIFKCIFSNENLCILIQFSVTFVFFFFFFFFFGGGGVKFIMHH